MQEALLYDALDADRVRCRVCCRQCVIAPGSRGVCGTRENRGGRLFTLIDSLVSSSCLDPIEKKPLYHFHPGTHAFSLGTLGCSFSCPGCQNWQISRGSILRDEASWQRMTPEEAVEHGVRIGAAGLCWTYNEPAIWLEYTQACASLAKARGLYTVYVTNGTASRDQLDLIGPHLDAYRVDIKAFSRESYRTVSGFADFESILDGVRYAKDRWGMHIECVTNVTPTINDSDVELRRIAHWIAEALGVDTPWHVTRFFPYQGLAHLPATPIDHLTRAAEIGRDEGLRYIYVGNVAGDRHQDTVCPGCGHVVIRRQGFTIVQHDLNKGACTACGVTIAGRWGGG